MVLVKKNTQNYHDQGYILERRVPLVFENIPAFLTEKLKGEGFLQKCMSRIY